MSLASPRLRSAKRLRRLIQTPYNISAFDVALSHSTPNSCRVFRYRFCLPLAPSFVLD